MRQRAVGLGRPALRGACDHEEVACAFAIEPAVLEHLLALGIEDVRVVVEHDDGAAVLERREERVEVIVRDRREGLHVGRLAPAAGLAADEAARVEHALEHRLECRRAIRSLGVVGDRDLSVGRHVLRRGLFEALGCAAHGAAHAQRHPEEENEADGTTDDRGQRGTTTTAAATGRRRMGPGGGVDGLCSAKALVHFSTRAFISEPRGRARGACTSGRGRCPRRRCVCRRGTSAASRPGCGWWMQSANVG